MGALSGCLEVRTLPSFPRITLVSKWIPLTTIAILTALLHLTGCGGGAGGSSGSNNLVVAPPPQAFVTRYARNFTANPDSPGGGNGETIYDGLTVVTQNNTPYGAVSGGFLHLPFGKAFGEDMLTQADTGKFLDIRFAVRFVMDSDANSVTITAKNQAGDHHFFVTAWRPTATNYGESLRILLASYVPTFSSGPYLEYMAGFPGGRDFLPVTATNPGAKGGGPFDSSKHYWLEYEQLSANPTQVTIRLREASPDLGNLAREGMLLYETKVTVGSGGTFSQPGGVDDWMDDLAQVGVCNNFDVNTTYGASRENKISAIVVETREALLPFRANMLKRGEMVTGKYTTQTDETGGLGNTVRNYEVTSDPTTPFGTGTPLNGQKGTAVTYTYSRSPITWQGIPIAGKWEWVRYRAVNNGGTPQEPLPTLFVDAYKRPAPGAVRPDILAGRPLVLVKCGDSNSDNAGFQPGLESRLAFYKIPNVTIVDAGWSGSELVAHWLPGSTNPSNSGAPNYLSQLITDTEAAVTAHPGALVVVSQRLLTNDIQNSTRSASEIVGALDTFVNYLHGTGGHPDWRLVTHWPTWYRSLAINLGKAKLFYDWYNAVLSNPKYQGDTNGVYLGNFVSFADTMQSDLDTNGRQVTDYITDTATLYDLVHLQEAASIQVASEDVDAVVRTALRAENATVPVITTQPQRTRVALGSSGQLKLTATNATWYVWEKKQADGSWAPLAPSGQAVATLNVGNTTSTAASTYRCQVYNGSGVQTSAEITVTAD